MELLIRQEALSLSLTPGQVRTLLTLPLRTLLRLEGHSPDTEISLLLCDDNAMRELNLAYRGQDKPTDVLSFAQEDDPALLGDLVISIPTAARQALLAGWLLEQELVLLSLHGLLHLLGEDDETARGAQLMQDKTIRALIESGIALPPEGNHPFFTEIEA